MEEDKNILTLIDEYQSLNLSAVLHHDKFLYYAITFHSTAIEGSTLTSIETRLLLDDGITPGGKPLEHSQMVKDHYDALRFTLDEARKKTPVSTILIQEINAYVMKHTGSVYHTPLGNIDAATGAFRKGNVSAGGHYFISYDKVPSLTRQLTEAIQKQIGNATTIEQQLELAFRAHYELVTIHPFYDGNGRTSRLLMNFILERSGLPLCILYKEDKALYYEGLQKGQQEGDRQPFFNFMYLQYEKHLREEIVLAQGLNPNEPGDERSL